MLMVIRKEEGSERSVTAGSLPSIAAAVTFRVLYCRCENKRDSPIGIAFQYEGGPVYFKHLPSSRFDINPLDGYKSIADLDDHAKALADSSWGDASNTEWGEVEHSSENETHWHPAKALLERMEQHLAKPRAQDTP